MSADIKEQREQIRTDFLISQLIDRDAALKETLGDIRELLARLPDVPARAAFESLCDFVITRTA